MTHSSRKLSVKQKPHSYRFLIEFEDGWMATYCRTLFDAARTTKIYEECYGATAISIRKADCGCVGRNCLPGKPFLRDVAPEPRQRVEASWETPGGKAWMMGCYYWKAELARLGEITRSIDHMAAQLVARADGTSASRGEDAALDGPTDRPAESEPGSPR